MSQELLTALSHPLRRRILRSLGGVSTAKNPAELADEVDADLSSVSYHVTVLEGAGVIHLKETQPRRGATAHFYVSAVQKNDHVRKILAATVEEDTHFKPKWKKNRKG